MSITSLLIVDDESGLREMLQEYFTQQGFRTLAAENAKAARALLSTETISMAIVDVNMPGEDGLSLTRHIRESHRIPIILLTAVTGVVDRIVGLEMGADDYVGKPFDPRELLARVRSVLRRTNGDGAAKSAEPAEHVAHARNTLPFAQFTLDIDSQKLLTENHEEIPLTAMEFDLLLAFAKNPNRVLSRERLLDLAHHGGWEPFDRSIDIRITRLRRKIEPNPDHPQIIKTIRGAGYVFVPAADQ